MRRLDPVDRFWKRVTKTDGCWLWTGQIAPNGYGSIPVYVDGLNTTVRAHRFSYELHVGPIPKGLVIDHLCRVRHCVNPEHLEVVTQAENLRRGNQRRGARGRFLPASARAEV